MARGAVRLGVDLGELPGEPEELYRLATLVHVACGGHAGDEASMRRALALAGASGALVAAHPSYPDRAGFGRTTMPIAAPDLRDAIARQCAALQRAARGGVRAVKLHGALYHDAARDPGIAQAVIEGAELGLLCGDIDVERVRPDLGAGGLAPPVPPRIESAGAREGTTRTGAERARTLPATGGSPPLIWIGPPRGALRERVLGAGGDYWCEGFADRGMQPDGSLIPRGRPGALIEEPARAADQALALARSGGLDVLCVHSDTRGAVEIARAVRRALEGAGLLADTERGGAA